MTKDEHAQWLALFLADLPDALQPILDQIPENARWELAQLLGSLSKPFPGGAKDRAHGHVRAAFLRDEISANDLDVLETYIREQSA